MSFWGKLAGIGLAGAGIVTGNPGLIGAGASIVAGDVASEASKDVAKTQSESADKALAMNQRMYDDTNARQAAVYAQDRQMYSPYVSLGAGAAGSLGNLLNLPGGSTSIDMTPNPATMPNGTAGATAGQAYMLDAQGRPTPILAGGGVLLGGPQQAAQQASQSGYSSLGGDRVLLEAPDGTKRSVDRGQAEFFKRRGAREVAS